MKNNGEVTEAIHTMISACAANTHRQTEEGILEPVLSVEGDGFREAGECVAVELALSSGKQLHIVVENHASRAVGRPGRQAGMRCVCSSIMINHRYNVAYL